MSATACSLLHIRQRVLAQIAADGLTAVKVLPTPTDPSHWTTLHVAVKPLSPGSDRRLANARPIGAIQIWEVVAVAPGDTIAALIPYAVAITKALDNTSGTNVHGRIHWCLRDREVNLPYRDTKQSVTYQQLGGIFRLDVLGAEQEA